MNKSRELGDDMGNKLDYVTVYLGNSVKNFILEQRGDNNPFRSGSRGFNAVGKLGAYGKRYQVVINIIEIGSKPNPKKE